MKSEPAKYKVTDEQEYANLLAQVDVLMRKGEKNVTAQESEEIRQIGIALQEYEQEIYPISSPRTLEGMMELKTYEKRLKQKNLDKEI